MLTQVAQRMRTGAKAGKEAEIVVLGVPVLFWSPANTCGGGGGQAHWAAGGPGRPALLTLHPPWLARDQGIDHFAARECPGASGFEPQSAYDHPPKCRPPEGAPGGWRPWTLRRQVALEEERIPGDLGHTAHCPSGRRWGSQVPQEQQVEIHLFLIGWLTAALVLFTGNKSRESL